MTARAPKSQTSVPVRARWSAWPAHPSPHWRRRGGPRPTRAGAALHRVPGASASRQPARVQGARQGGRAPRGDARVVRPGATPRTTRRSPRHHPVRPPARNGEPLLRGGRPPPVPGRRGGGGLGAGRRRCCGRSPPGSRDGRSRSSDPGRLRFRRPAEARTSRSRIGPRSSSDLPLSRTKSNSSARNPTTVISSKAARAAASSCPMRAPTLSARSSGKARRAGCSRSALSSMSARSRPTTNSGLPRARSMSHATSASGAGPPITDSARSRMSPAGRAVTVRRLSSPSCSNPSSTSLATRSSASSAGRAASSNKMRQSTKFRVRKLSASHEDPSARWTSSSTITTGVSALRRPSSPARAPSRRIRGGSAVSPPPFTARADGRSAARSTTSPAHNLDTSDRSSPRRWRSRPSAHNPRDAVAPSGYARADRVTISLVWRRASSVAKRVLPTPGSPTINTARSCPSRARDSSSSSWPRSSSRPTNSTLRASVASPGDPPDDEAQTTSNPSTGSVIPFRITSPTGRKVKPARVATKLPNQPGRRGSARPPPNRRAVWQRRPACRNSRPRPGSVHPRAARPGHPGWSSSLGRCAVGSPAACRSRGKRTAPTALGNTTMSPSPRFLTSSPPEPPTTSRRSEKCARLTSSAATSPK